MINESQSIAQNLPEPDFIESTGTFEIIFRGNDPENRIHKILETIGHDPAISRADLARITGFSDVTIKRDLGKLKKLGVLRRVGSDKGGYWEIIEALNVVNEPENELGNEPENEPEKRVNAILSAINRDPKISVHDLVKLTGIKRATIKRDLDKLSLFKQQM